MPALGIQDCPACKATPHCVRYDRRRDLPRLLPLTKGLIDDGCLGDDREVMALLARAIQRERTRGVAGAWAYDPARHRLMLMAYRCESARCREAQSP